ncbi:MAG: SusF/SusE family outer membrane protein, partial [Candidatus Cryptobacteroides sp.]|nr:SusF/SusE family outer membrane protein [Candidatus Cryptobacteroides sp.]
ISGGRACLVGGVNGGSNGESNGVLADLVVAAGTVKYDAYFKLAGAVLQFNIFDSGTPSGELIKSVKVSATGANLSGDFTVDYDGNSVNAAGTGNSVTVNVESREIVVADKKYTKAVYAVIVPATIAANDGGSVTYTIETYGGSVYEFTSKKAKNWESGVITPINIDLANATKTTKYQTAAPVFVSTHPYSKTEGTDMTKTESGVYTIKHIWVSGQNYDINFKFKVGEKDYYYNAYNGDTNAYVSSEDPEFDVVVSDEPFPLKIQQWGGKNYTEKYCTFILDTNKMKLKVLQDRGERFWITGDNLSWELDKYEMDVNKQAGKATWSGYLKAGNFKIHGEKLWEGKPEDRWEGPDKQTGAGEWYFLDDSRENGISMNRDSDKKWNLAEAGYYTLEFNYKSSPMTFTITKKDYLDLTVNGNALTYAENNQYTIETTFKKGDTFTLAGCKNLEYVMMDPDFLIKKGDSYKFNAVDGRYKFILHLGSHDVTYNDGAKQYPQNSWTLFKGMCEKDIFTTTKVLVGAGVADLTVMNCMTWDKDTFVKRYEYLPHMAQIETGVYQFTGRYKQEWSNILPYDRWAKELDFKYYGQLDWNDPIPDSVTLDDKTNSIQQSTAEGKVGNLTWADSNDKWEHDATYRLTVDTRTSPHTVKFEKIVNQNK